MAGIPISKQPGCNYEPGIYFNMPNEIYHRDGAVSNSGIKLLREEPIDYWWRTPAVNPLAEHIASSKAMEDSDILHMLILEPERFHRNFTVGKIEYGKKMMSNIKYEKLLMAKRVFMAMPRCQMLFSGGVTEVSIFLRCPETGVMIRCRPDYMKPNMVVDYKAHRRTDDYGIKQDLVTYGYDVQSGFYTWAAEEIRRLINTKQAGVFTVVDAGKDRGKYSVGAQNEAQEKWLKEFLAGVAEQLTFIYSFQRKTIPNVIKPRRIARSILQLGLEKARQGLSIYRNCLETYGTDPWPMGGDDIEDIDTDDLSNRVFHT